jgi:hypothetical protein
MVFFHITMRWSFWGSRIRLGHATLYTLRSVSSIQHGEVYPELLFMDDSEEGKRVVLHPAILWKLINVRNHLARAQTKTKPKF